jgi:hypothetical protein
MITDRAMMALSTALDEWLPPDCGFALAVFSTKPMKFMPDLATAVDVACVGSIHDASSDVKEAVALALHGLADQLAADAQASAGPSQD